MYHHLWTSATFPVLQLLPLATFRVLITPPITYCVLLLRLYHLEQCTINRLSSSVFINNQIKSNTFAIVPSIRATLERKQNPITISNEKTTDIPCYHYNKTTSLCYKSHPLREYNRPTKSRSVKRAVYYVGTKELFDMIWSKNWNAACPYARVPYLYAGTS